jgi:hypothetical protein
LDLTVAGFSAFMAGEPIPAVDPHDLRGVATPQSSISVALLAEACAPGANVIAVSLRGLLLDAMASQGLLPRPFPMPALNRFHPYDFVRSLAAQRD